MSKKRIAIMWLLAAALAACSGGTTTEDTTDTAPSTTAVVETTTTTVAETTTTSVPATTTTAAAAAPTTTTGASGGEGDLSIIQEAMAQSSEQKPARIEGTMEISGMEGAGDAVLEMPFSMSVDNATGNSAMIMDFSGMAELGGEEIPAELGDLFGDFEIRSIDGTDYIRFGFFNTFLGADTDWVSTPSEGDDVADDFGTSAPNDPAQYLDSLSDAEGDVEELGTEELRGTQVTHYRVLVDADYLADLSEEERAELEAQGPLPTGEFPLEVWIDDERTIHRFLMTIDGGSVTQESLDGTEAFGTMTMQFDFFDFGDSVEIEAPPADQVTDMESLEGGFFGPTPSVP
jgi:hypothetical protein